MAGADSIRLTPATLRDRTVGIVGMGRIGQAIARRLDGFGVPVVYHSRNPQAGVAYKHYPELVDMARDVDTLHPDHAGRPADQAPDQRRGARCARAARHRHQHGARLGGGRGGADQGAEGQEDHAAGLDVFANEPEVPKELIAMDNVVLFPHLGSATVGDAPGDGPTGGRQPPGLGARASRR